MNKNIKSYLMEFPLEERIIEHARIRLLTMLFGEEYVLELLKGCFLGMDLDYEAWKQGV